jgi:hypothetical protein
MEVTTIRLVYPMSRTTQNPYGGEWMVGAAVLGLLNQDLTVRVLISGVDGHFHIVNMALLVADQSGESFRPQFTALGGRRGGV